MTSRAAESLSVIALIGGFCDRAHAAGVSGHAYKGGAVRKLIRGLTIDSLAQSANDRLTYLVENPFPLLCLAQDTFPDDLQSLVASMDFTEAV